MTDINPTPSWANVRQLETNEFASGGANGNMNEQAKSLAARSELLKQYVALPYESKTGGYALNERVQLATGDIVRSAIPSNVNNPNENMTGWVKTNSSSQIFDASGLNQQEVNNGVESIANLIAIPNPKNGNRVYVKSYHAGLGKGGGGFIYNSSRASENDGGNVINGWVRVNTRNYVYVPEFGVKGDGETNDTPAMQKALDYAYANSLDVQLCNDINLTGGTLLIPSTKWTPVITISGGSIIKNDTGFVLSSSAVNKSRDAPVLKNIKFSRGSGTGKPYVFDANKMIRQQVYNCRFRDFCLVQSNDYIQSLRFISNTVYSQPDVFIKAGYVFDMKILSNAFESAGNPLLEILGHDQVGGPYAITNCVINDNVIEGYDQSAAIIIPDCASLTISDNYFELVKYVLVQRKLPSDVNPSYFCRSFKFTGNYVAYITSNYVLHFERPLRLAYTAADISANFISNFQTEGNNYFSNAAFFEDAHRTNFMPPSVQRSKSKSFTKTSRAPTGSGGFSFTASTGSGGGAEAVIKNLFAQYGAGDTKQNIAKTAYLVTVSGQHSAASTIYRFSYTGILSFALLHNSAISNIALTLKLDALSFNGTSGQLNGANSAASDVSIRFAQNDLNYVLFNENFGEDQLRIIMPNVVSIDSVVVVPINSIVKETDYSVMPYDARP